MLTFFRSNQASAGVFLLLYAALLQLAAWFVGQGTTDISSGGILAQWWLGGIRPGSWLTWVLPVILVTAQGVLANVLISRHRMSRTVTQFPGLFLVVCWALVPAFRVLHPVQFAGLSLMLALLSLGRTYKSNEPAVALFNVGFWVGTAALFYLPALLLLPAFLIGVGTLRRFSFRSLFQILTGVGVVYFLAFSWAYFTGQLGQATVWQFSGYGLGGLLSVEPPHFAGMIALTVLVVYAILSFGPTTQLLNIEGKKNASVLLWLLFFIALGYWLTTPSSLPYLQLLSIPVGIITGLRCIQIDWGRAELFHLVLLIVIISPLLWLAFA